MPVNTLVSWGRDTVPVLTEEELKKIDERELVWIDAGKTDGHVWHTLDGVIRVWADLETAQEFLDFINTFDPPPAVAKIKE